MADSIADIRREHVMGSLSGNGHQPRSPSNGSASGLAMRSLRLLQPNAMTLSTVDADGRPNARIVLLKGFDESSFVFYTHRTSRRAKLAANPHAALTFFWDSLERQIRIQGSVEWTTDAESDEYFQSRPRGSQLRPSSRSRVRSSPIGKCSSSRSRN